MNSDNSDYNHQNSSIVQVNIEKEMELSYLNYAMSVIVGRALPDVRDGLKPVHRRILFAMNEANNYYNKPYKKSARIVGDVMGKYHPHGDSAIYDSIVRMAQDFSIRYLIIDGQGNFGSVDGDSAAAMRYTEIRMTKIAHSMLSDIDKETVDFALNYDGQEKEPTVLPTSIPNLLINGTTGIAVGMATSIPPHNLSEVINGLLALINNPDCTIEELMEFIPGPDFPTKAIILGTAGIKSGYKTGKGKVIMRARTHCENLSTDKQAIIIDELPYQVNKAKLCERIAEIIKDKTIEGILDVRDESDKVGMRVVVELRRGENAEVIMNQLCKMTQMQDSFSINMVALVKGQPKLLNLKDILFEFIAHRREIITRKTIFELKKAKERAHILEGLAVALFNIDEIIEIIKTAASPNSAKQKLMSKLWQADLIKNMLSRVDPKLYRLDLTANYGLEQDKYTLSDLQAQAILDLKLQRLTALEQNKINDEYKNIIDLIIDLIDILNQPQRITEIIKGQLIDIKHQFGDDRLSFIDNNFVDLNDEDLITPRDMVVTLSRDGYIKTQSVTDYKTQKRGGRGKSATNIKDLDEVQSLFFAHTHDYLLCFSTLGRLYWLKPYNLPEGGRTSRGKPINNILPLQMDEKITAVLSVKNFSSDKYVFMATAAGVVKKTNLEAFSHPSNRGIIAINLDQSDQLIGVLLTDGQQEIMLFSNGCKAVRFNESAVRSSGRTARGVKGIKLTDNSKVVALLSTNNLQAQILAVTTNGYGKRTKVEEYRLASRGTQGVRAIGESNRNGKLVTAILVEDSDEILVISHHGVMIRTKVSSIRQTGRSAQGVRVIKLDQQDTLVAVEVVLSEEPLD